jgi:hypothetical protein
MEQSFKPLLQKLDNKGSTALKWTIQEIGINIRLSLLLSIGTMLKFVYKCFAGVLFSFQQNAHNLLHTAVQGAYLFSAIQVKSCISVGSAGGHAHILTNHRPL